MQGIEIQFKDPINSTESGKIISVGVGFVTVELAHPTAYGKGKISKNLQVRDSAIFKTEAVILFLREQRKALLKVKGNGNG